MTEFESLTCGLREVRARTILADAPEAAGAAGDAVEERARAAERRRALGLDVDAR